MCKNNFNKNRKWRRERKKRRKNYFTLFPTYPGTKAQFPACYRAVFDETKSTYVETCVGAGGMVFNISNGKYKNVYLNDLNINLMMIYKCLRDKDLQEEFMKRLEEVQIPDDEKDAKAYFENLRKKMYWWTERPKAREDILDTAAKTYLLYAISKNCNADEYSAKQAKNFHDDIKRRFPNVIESLHCNVRFYCLNAIKIIDLYKNDSSVQFFIDTPYVGIYRSNKALYKEDMLKLSDHLPDHNLHPVSLAPNISLNITTFIIHIMYTSIFLLTMFLPTRKSFLTSLHPYPNAVNIDIQDVLLYKDKALILGHL